MITIDMIRAAILSFLLVLSSLSYAIAASYHVTVTGVHDGDTFAIDTPWMEFKELRFFVRVRGVDTPESGAKARCRSERERADIATNRTRELIAQSGGVVELRDVRHDKYGGRLNAQVYLLDGRNLADVLISEGLARPYDGKGIRKGWCNTPDPSPVVD